MKITFFVLLVLAIACFVSGARMANAPGESADVRMGAVIPWAIGLLFAFGAVAAGCAWLGGL